MSRNTKIILAIGGGLLALCCMAVAAFAFGAARFGQALSDPSQGPKVGHEIVDYTLPAGYKELTGLNLLGTKFVLIGPDDNGDSGLLMMLFQTPAGANREQMEQQLRDAFARQQPGVNANFQKTGEQTVTIKDQPVPFTVYEGTSTSNDKTVQYKQLIGVFQGKGGTVMLMAMGPSDGFDSEAFDSFTRSIR